MQSYGSVLLVDDEPIILNGLLSFPWARLGFPRYSGAANGADALKSFKENPVDLIVTDIRMPKLDGLALSRKVMEIKPSTRIIILTGFREFDLVKQALQAGVVEFLLKPVDPSELEDLVCRLRREIDEEKATENRIFEKSPSAFGILRIADPFTIDSDFWIRELYNKLGDDYLGQLFLGKDLALLLGEGVTATILNNALLEILNNLDPSIKIHASWGISLHDATKAIERCFYNEEKKTNGFVLTVEMAPCPLPTAPEQEKNLIRITLEGKSKEIKKALEDLYDCWGLTHNPPYPNELKNRFINIANQISQSIENSGLVLPSIEKKSAIDSLRLSTTISQLLESTLELFTQVAEKIKETNDGLRTSSHWSIRRAVEFIEKNYAKPLSLTEIAEQNNLSPSYFSIRFKKVVGINYIDFIKKTRIEQAKKLLLDSDLKVYEVGSAVGYHDVKHFTQVFKEVTGIPPLAYRRKIILPRRGQ